MKYVDYTFYSQEYGGIVPEAEFLSLEIRASSLVDYYTFDRILEADLKIKLCICELIDEIRRQKKVESGVVKSETTSKYSVSYFIPSEKDNKSDEKKVYNIILRWLGNTGLMYRGV